MACPQSSSLSWSQQNNSPASGTCSLQSSPDGEWTVLTCAPREDTVATEDIAIDYTPSGTGTTTELARPRRPATQTSSHQPCYCCIHNGRECTARRKGSRNNATDDEWIQQLSVLHDTLARRRDEVMLGRTKAGYQQQQYNYYRNELEVMLSRFPIAAEPAPQTQTVQYVNTLHKDIQRGIATLREQSRLLDDSNNEMNKLEFKIASEEARLVELLRYCFIDHACRKDGTMLDSSDDSADESSSDIQERPAVLQQLYDRIGDAAILEERLAMVLQHGSEADAHGLSPGHPNMHHLNQRGLEADMLEANRDIRDLEQQCFMQGIDTSHLCQDEEHGVAIEDSQYTQASSCAGEQESVGHSSAAGLPHHLRSASSVWVKKAWQIWEADRSDDGDRTLEHPHVHSS
ncbi:hypothetical protein K431DRAFT_291015 [Polychaeton citri CBS 116435]|uniref:Uncharacterized protein n=1 Tax=Polychaeton citri CBS 116435 TaxID=1314669 RepID=A0A9P4QGW8_9PEZI|nr:hypothetical protein K431DRAFT_291015 [Polychaeton citri CBS 116435]